MSGAWKKLGLIFKPDSSISWMQSHAQLPVVDAAHKDFLRVYFAGRDATQRSHVGIVDLEAREPYRVIRVHPEPILKPGPVGSFSRDGVYPSSIVTVGKKKFLYFIGWMRGTPNPLFGAAIGLAVSDDDGLTFAPVCPGPVLSTGPFDPLLVTGPSVVRVGAEWRMYYVSGLRWEETPQGLHSYYHIKIAVSGDGMTWRTNDKAAVPLLGDGESNLGRPCVVANADGFQMWFCSARPDRNYRLETALSKNGVDWTRTPVDAALAPTPGSFDADEVAYPYVVDVGDKSLLFYNGNGHGRDGFALAVRPR